MDEIGEEIIEIFEDIHSGEQVERFFALLDSAIAIFEKVEGEQELECFNSFRSFVEEIWDENCDFPKILLLYQESLQESMYQILRVYLEVGGRWRQAGCSRDELLQLNKALGPMKSPQFESLTLRNS